METPEPHLGLKDYDRVLVKGKRTKRQRLILQQQQPATAMTSSSSGLGGDDDRSDRMSSSPTTSTQFSGSTEEEEDMANCLILLAQGAFQPKLEEEAAATAVERFSSRKFIQTATAASTAKAGFYVYECKTCNRCFPSFQALGGHRASHKKPKMGEEKKAPQEEENCNQITSTTSSSFSPPKPVPYNKSRVHECSICGSEFSSGQALGGHMRRHRSASIADSQEHSNKKERSVLSLDLNLPAPEEDREFSTAGGFTFSSKQPLVFAASSLVDCPH